MKLIYCKILLIIFLSCFCFHAYSQTYELLLIENSGTDNKFLNKLNYKKKFPLKESRKKELNEIILYFYNEGFITARFDSLINDSLLLKAYLNIGKKFELAYLRKVNVDDALLSEVGYKEKLYSDKAFNYDDIRQLNEKILSFCENNAYPFASIKLDSIIIDSNSITASLLLNKSYKITIDSIIIKGKAKISNAYIYNYLGIKPGDFYDESLVKKISVKLKELQFVREIKPFNIVFTEKDAKIYLYLNKRDASSFDGVIGILPNNVTTGKLMINGDVRLKLLNSFNRGELIDFNWRKLEQSTQDLKFNIVYPYILRTPFGIDYKFLLFKKDTLYLTLKHNIGVQYIFGGNNYLKIFLDNYQSSLVNTEGLENLTVLPNYADIKTNLFGLEYNYINLDYLYNPRKGYRLRLSGAAGIKNIEKNGKINQALYDSLELKTTQYNFETEINLFIPILKRSTILIRNQSAYIANSNLFENELFRIGGLRTIRGFDEESIKASLFSIFLIEYRYLFEQNSYFNIFFNGAYYEKDIHNEFICDRPLGFGLGLNFQTKAGIFSINYALGKQFNNPVDIKSAKIHFGIVNYF